ncbi:uncharacterized protein LOC123891019 isoform X1 [Trifolium pratense]|uniref:uncharacterized protein LOC123891019 isoform X1 n=1 Tax=Trifolium pratense TaxID=57577 RepID=UPI001E692FFE|nr:uncharacterized protein LOC123891019 isoform X1 [Trifolium pratense]XP_045796753.1 uncharacterized protein LOC123891019 isoform X1 [Trifolium pratense]
MVTFRGKLCEGSCLNGHFLSQLCNRFTNPATTKIDEDLELRYPHKGMFKELLKNEGSQNYGLIVIQFYQKIWVCFDYQKMEYSVSEINYQRLLFMNLKKNVVFSIESFDLFQDPSRSYCECFACCRCLLHRALLLSGMQ